MINGRIVIIMELKEDLDDEDIVDWDLLRVVDIRHYEMKDEEQVAIQVTRELVMAGKNPDPKRTRFFIIGGDIIITADSHFNGDYSFPVSRVPGSIWKPVPPDQPMWRAERLPWTQNKD